MKPGWATFSLGLASGIGAFLVIAVVLEIPEFTQSGFCEAKETILTCTREWANVFAILSGAIVVLVTIAGQQAEAARHAETIRQANTPDARRVARGRIVFSRLQNLKSQLDVQIHEARRANEKDVGTAEVRYWQRMIALCDTIEKIQDDNLYKGMNDLFDYKCQLAISKLFLDTSKLKTKKPPTDFTSKSVFTDEGMAYEPVLMSEDIRKRNRDQRLVLITLGDIVSNSIETVLETALIMARDYNVDR